MINKLEVGLLARVLVNQALLILKDKEIVKLQKQVQLSQAATDRMEACYIEMKKEAEQLQSELKCCRQENAVLIRKQSIPHAIRDDVFQKKGEPCRHFSTTMFHNGRANCFNCLSIVNERREVIEGEHETN